VPALADYLDITVEAARAQWLQILRRSVPAAGKKQEIFLPVETLSVFAATFVVNHRRFGGGNRDTAPSPVPELAALGRRSIGSILRKMQNLDGSAAHGAKNDRAVAAALHADIERFSSVYAIMFTAARDVGIGPDRLPDFLGLGAGEALHLLGQEEIDVSRVLDEATEILRAASAEEEKLTARMVLAEARVGQHRFATGVLRSYAHRCGFCGLAPGPDLERKGLLLASHIKPWAVCDGRERLDPRNGIAACPTHDRAFDSGLLWVNGGYRIHASPALERAAAADPAMAAAFGRPPLRDRLVTSEDRPHALYLAWHQLNIAVAT
jgi:putative restriction endonuclease